MYAISASFPEEANLKSGFTLVNSDTSLQLSSSILNKNLLIYFQFTVNVFRFRFFIKDSTKVRLQGGAHEYYWRIPYMNMGSILGLELNLEEQIKQFKNC